MKEFFKDIFKYHHHYNQKLADLLMANPDKVSEKTIQMFSHSMNAHQIWNARILNQETLGVHQIHTFQKCRALDSINFDNTLKILDQFSLDKRINYKTSKGDAFENSIQEILFHTANHFTHHRGQIMSDIKQHGIEPLVTDYIFYKR